MESSDGGSCSTEFEASGSAVSAASEQYDEDDFDDYSDSFEEEEDNGVTSPLEASAASGSRRVDALPVGTRVQVLWLQENEWFDGAIQHVEDGNEPRYYVLYDDGEQQWESAANTRPLPATISSTARYDQLQQLLPVSAQSARAVMGRRAAVYWSDESEWYSGVVGAAKTSPPALKIDYDDGDSRWEHEHVFNCILLLREELEAPDPLDTSSGPALTSGPPSPPGLVLYARPYRQAVSDHFQPVRIARPYRCAVEKHSESVLIPRRSYSERRFIHTVHEALQCAHFQQQTKHHSLFPEKVDSVAQTALPSSSTEP